MKQKNHSELWFDCSDKNISYFARVPQKGPELDLVYEFLNRIVLKTRMPNQSQAIFIEPKLASGFPDVVIASYAPKNYSNKFWKKERSLIVPQDLKFLWYLYGQNGADNIQVIKELNLSSAILLNSVTRLLDAGLIIRDKKAHRWCPAGKISDVFGLRDLTAVEAKINDWSTVFSQANLNRWFASKSYVLSPVIKPDVRFLNNFEECGIGVYSLPKNGHLKQLLKPEIRRIPSSYASWLFNEWIGRRLSV